MHLGLRSRPPANRTTTVLNEKVRRYSPKLRVVYRNLPLTAIHPFAEHAAIAAEIAKQQGKFLALRDLLFNHTGALEPNVIEALSRRAGVTKMSGYEFQFANAKRSVRDDEAEALRLGLSGTPALLLCVPEGKVWNLHSVAQLDQYVQ